MRNSIEEVAASYVQLKRRGRNLVGLCPFHNEHTPSFNLYPENGSFYCFGCGAGGDIITFVRRIENLDYIEAVKFLADRAGLQMPQEGVDDSVSRLRRRIFEINRESAKFFHAMLKTPQGKVGLDYFLQRGLLPATLTHFGLGFAPDSRFALVNHLKAKGYSEEEMVQANVAVRARSGRAMDRFFNRVMFPIIDLRGNVIAFGGRILSDDKPKYLNTADTLVFKKSYGLFALNFAKNSAQDQLILAEGYMDVIALHQAGFSNAVAGLGTALTSEQAHLIARYAKEVVIAYDSDEAGQKATARAISLLRNVGLLVKVLAIPQGKDPDEFMRSYGQQGPARFKQLLLQCGNDVEYRMQKLRLNCDLESSAGKVQYLNDATALLATLENPMEREIYAGKLAEEIGIARASVTQQVEKLSRQRRKADQKREFREFQQQSTGLKDKVNPEKHRNFRAANAEEALIAYLFLHNDAAKQIRKDLPPEQFTTAFNRRVYEAITDKMMTGAAVGLTDISDVFTMEEIGAIAAILARHNAVLVGQKDAQEYVRVIVQEKNKLNASDLEQAQTQDIQNYLARLREQKR